MKGIENGYKNMKIIGYIFIFAATVFATVACGGEKKAEMTPEAVVETFCRAVAAGDFDAAREVCDSAGMDGYMENYRKVMDSLEKRDSSALKIAASMLSGAEFEVVGTEKDGEERIVKYRISAEGRTKTKQARVRKEEEGWRVAEITDAI